MPLLNFDPPVEIRGELYRAVVQFAVARGLPSALLVVRDEDALADSARTVLDQLAPFLDAREDASSWPGTELFGHTATVYRYRLNDDTAGVLVGAADGVFDWVEPGLPEDPCLLRADGTAWLTTIAHERDAYFTLSAGEREELLRELPDLAPLVASPDQ